MARLSMMNKLLIVVIIVAEISRIFSIEDNPSKVFVVELNKLLVNNKISDDYCIDERIFCDNDQISIVNLEAVNISRFPVEIIIIKDTLKSLTITYANLKGNIPDEIYKLTELEYLNLEGTNLVLSYLDLNGSSLSGSIPDGLYSLTELEYLNLQGSKFNGGLSGKIRDMNKLLALDLSGSNLSGPIPDDLYSLTELRYLNLQQNRFDGGLNDKIRDLNKLLYLDLSGSNISGSIPDGLYSLTKLEYLYLMGNSINGTLSPKIGNMIRLTSLNLSFNQLSGIIPNEIGNLINLKDLEMRENKFEGNIPDLSRLEILVNMNISSTKHILNASCDNKTLPPYITKNRCFIAPVNRLCNSTIHCEYSNKPVDKSSIGSMFYTPILKMVVMMIACRGVIETERFIEG
ncbi:uncharacterized protein LOC126329792 [Schistocerca gregaria]|uniref:uncharacterized protein LOC126329792 n=1 Tax=Schistocerca gregaria TaxID=7010 RepID=UPI00211E8A97|nr:uncharacterized protein LOC126329792 [Schistocerca gregaria]